MNIAIIGGDSRIVELSSILLKKKITANKDFNISYYGMENCKTIIDSKDSESLETLLENSNVVITSIPLTKDGVLINAPYSKNEIYVKDVLKELKNKKVFTGNVTKEISDYLKEKNGCEVIDILKNEELAILNSIPTAEGAIKIAIEKSNITINGSKCLIMGYGRIGKILANMLSGFGADIYCEARKEQDLAMIKTYRF